MQNWNRQDIPPRLSLTDVYGNSSRIQVGGIVSFLPEDGHGKLSESSPFAAANKIICTNHSSKDPHNKCSPLAFIGPSVKYENFGPSVKYDNFPEFVVNNKRTHTGSKVDIQGSIFSNIADPPYLKETSQAKGELGFSKLIQDYRNASYTFHTTSNYERSYESIRKYAIEREHLAMLSSIIQIRQAKQSPLINFLREYGAKPNKYASGAEAERMVLSQYPKGSQYFGQSSRLSPYLQNLEIVRENHIDNQKVSSQALKLSVMLQNNMISENRISKQTTIIPLEDLLSDSKFVSIKLRGHASDSLILAFAQMKPCRLNECDKFGKYKHRELNSIGMCCKHCGGSPGCGRFFPSTYASFVNGTNPEHILGHVGHVCQACPAQIREAIQELERLEASEPLKLRYGSRKRFFSYFWKRIHEYGDILPLVGEASLSDNIESSNQVANEAKSVASDLGYAISEPIAKRARLS